MHTRVATAQRTSGMPSWSGMTGIRPSKPVAIARVDGMKYGSETRTFTTFSQVQLSRTGFYDQIPATWAYSNGADNTAYRPEHTRHCNLTFYGRFPDFFPGFNKVLENFEAVRPLSLTCKAIITNSAFKSAEKSDRIGIAQQSEAYLPFPSDSIYQCDCHAVVDYNGKNGQAGVEHYTWQDYQNNAASSRRNINAKSWQTLFQFVPQQLIPANNSSPPKIPNAEKALFYSREAFIDSQGATLTNCPIFGGVQATLVSYNAAGAGFAGTTADTEPCLGVTLQWDFKAAFKGQVNRLGNK